MSDCCEPEISFEIPSGEDTDQAIARLAKGLAHPARVKILRILAERDRCLCGEIVDCFDLAQSTISQHLKILKEADLIRGEVEGPTTCYCLNRSALEWLGRRISEIPG